MNIGSFECVHENFEHQLIKAFKCCFHVNSDSLKALIFILGFIVVLILTIFEAKTESSQKNTFPMT